MKAEANASEQWVLVLLAALTLMSLAGWTAYRAGWARSYWLRRRRATDPYISNLPAALLPAGFLFGLTLATIAAGGAVGRFTIIGGLASGALTAYFTLRPPEWVKPTWDRDLGPGKRTPATQAESLLTILTILLIAGGALLVLAIEVVRVVGN